MFHRHAVALRWFSTRTGGDSGLNPHVQLYIKSKGGAARLNTRTEVTHRVALALRLGYVPMLPRMLVLVAGGKVMQGKRIFDMLEPVPGQFSFQSFNSSAIRSILSWRNPSATLSAKG